MSNFSVDGLVSGLQTSSMVDAMMAVERLPQQDLQTKVKKFEKAIEAMQGINSKLKTLGEKAEAATKPAFWAKASGTSTDESVTVDAESTAAAASLTFDVTKVAQAEVRSYDLGAYDPNQPEGTVDYQAGPPPVINVSGSNANPQTVAQAINAANGDYTATVVNQGDGTYKLLVSSKSPGLNQYNMQVTMNGSAASSQVLTQGQDAEIVIGSDPNTAMTVTSSSNTFKDLMTGVDVTVSQVATGVTVGAGVDNEALTEDVKGMVEGLNEILSTVKTKTYASGQGIGDGPLIGNSTMRGLSMQLQSAASGYAGDGIAAESGIEIDRYGKFEFDESKFQELLEVDPAKAQSIVADIASKIQTVSERYSDSVDGMLSMQIKSKQGQVTGLNDQIEGWDRRLEMREMNLKRQFAAMETMLSGISGQANWLAGQLGAMSGQ